MHGKWAYIDRYCLLWYDYTGLVEYRCVGAVGSASKAPMAIFTAPRIPCLLASSLRSPVSDNTVVAESTIGVTAPHKQPRRPGTLRSNAGQGNGFRSGYQNTTGSQHSSHRGVARIINRCVGVLQGKSPPL